MKIVFIGHPGSGKTYAATTLARRVGVKEIDIDVLFDNLVYLFFKRPYIKALNKLLKDKTAWIIDGYGGKRTPAYLWNEADHIVCINLPKSELTQNVISRYRLQKTNNESVHSQGKFRSLIKSLWHIYVRDGLLKGRVHDIKNSSNADKMIEVNSRQELDNLINELASAL